MFHARRVRYAVHTGMLATICATGMEILTSRPAFAAITIQLDYTYDTNSFFPVGSQQRATLAAAARVFSDRFLDHFTAITPSGSNTWTMDFVHPGSGATQTLTNQTIAADTIRVFAGGRNLNDAIPGSGGAGGFVSSGTQAWTTSIGSRGQASTSPPSDYALWGGAICFDNVPSSPWNFDLAAPVSGKNDFFSVAVHELAHLLGFGRAGSFTRFVLQSKFTGPITLAANAGTAAPMLRDGEHWTDGTNSTIGGAMQLAAMTQAAPPVTRLNFTLLDFAAMDDMGWDLAGAGDANADGTVNTLDFNKLSTSFNQSGKFWSDGDFNYDGRINALDFNAIASHYGQTSTNAGIGAVVPEPASVFVVGAAVTPMRRRRRQG